MITDLLNLPTRAKTGGFHVVVESPRDSRVKIKYDPELGAFKFSRPLVMGLRYPYDWGFIPGTAAPDGDPLDAMVFSDLSTFPGVVIECRALGLIRLKQNRRSAAGRERNDRLIAVPMKMPRFAGFKNPRICHGAGGRSLKNSSLRRRDSKAKTREFSVGLAQWRVNGGWMGT